MPANGEMMEAVYKVVRKKDRRLLSAWVDTPETEVEYKEGVETFPKAGNLFAFITLKEAIYFLSIIPNLRDTESYEVWECHTPVYEIMISNSNSNYSLLYPRRVVSLHDAERISSLRKGNVPRGSIVCPSLTLIRKVTP